MMMPTTTTTMVVVVMGFFKMIFAITQRVLHRLELH